MSLGHESPDNPSYARHFLLSSISNLNSRASCSPPFCPFSERETKLIRKRHFCTIRNFRSDKDSDEAFSTNCLVCPGCGVYMQDSDPKQPGFFTKPSQKSPDYHARHIRIPVADEADTPNCIKKAVIGDLDERVDDGRSCDVPKKPVDCARCHSLRHYGRVKDASVENFLPDFDFDHTIGRILISASGSRTVVLMVIDAADFDGSFPREVAKLVSTNIENNSAAWKQGKPGNVPRVIFVVTKIVLLPPSICPSRFEHWVRQRAHDTGSNKITSVHLVSAVKDWVLKNLLDDMRQLAG